MALADIADVMRGLGTLMYDALIVWALVPVRSGPP